MITNEMKVDIFYLYSKAKVWVTRYSPREFTVREMLPEIEEQVSDFDGKHLDKYQLILKPLSEITDEDAIEVAKIIIDKPTTSHYNITRNNTTIWNGHNVVHIMPDGELIWSNTFVDVKLSTVKALRVADFLRSKSYALPYAGLDLFASGIAIPKQ